MNTEDTIYGNNAQTQSNDSEATQFSEQTTENTVLNNEKAADEQPAEEQPKKKIQWKTVAIGGASGLMLGVAGTVLTSFVPRGEAEGENGTTEGTEASHPDWVDGEVPVAESVTDDMSFSEAFAAARAEVGPGGVFQWHGYIYGTYTADEWNSMSDAQHAEYGSHFNWTGGTPTEDVATTTHTTTHHVDTPTPVTPTEPEDVVVVDPKPDGPTGDDPVPPVTPGEIEVDPEVEILGVIHGDETGGNVGGMTVDGQEILLLDVDGIDDEFDFAVSDINHDGEIQENEITDISEQHISVSEFEQAANANIVADYSDTPDYINDADIYDV